MPAAERRRETTFSNNKENEKCIDVYLVRETAVAIKRVEDAATAIKQEQEEMRSAESGELTYREPGQTLEEMLDDIRDSLSNLASTDDEDTVQGKVSKDDEPSWAIGTISKTVQQRVERFRQKQMKLDKLTQ